MQLLRIPIGGVLMNAYGWLLLLLGVTYLVASGILFQYYVVRIHKARAWLTHGAVLLDVDRPDEFARYHPKRSVSMPLESLLGPWVLRDPTRPIVVFAHSWWRGIRAVRLLRSHGCKSVLNVAGVHTREHLASEREPPPEGIAPTVRPRELIALAEVPTGEMIEESHLDIPRSSGYLRATGSPRATLDDDMS
jgi:rhodanese-related sulfurtransferase